jgi:hypothetical protein
VESAEQTTEDIRLSIAEGLTLTSSAAAGLPIGLSIAVKSVSEIFVRRWIRPRQPAPQGQGIGSRPRPARLTVWLYRWNFLVQFGAA